MEEIILTKIDEINVTIEASKGVLLEISEKFSFSASGYKYNPKYKHGQWDGKIKLFHLATRKFPIGLLFELFKFCKKEGYKITLKNKEDFRLVNFDKELEEYREYTQKISNRSIEGDYEYQWLAIENCLKKNKVLTLSPTSCMDEETLIDMKLTKEMESLINEIRKVEK